MVKYLNGVNKSNLKSYLLLSHLKYLLKSQELGNVIVKYLKHHLRKNGLAESYVFNQRKTLIRHCQLKKTTKQFNDSLEKKNSQLCLGSISRCGILVLRAKYLSECLLIICTFSQASLEECTQLCDRTAGCIAFSYDMRDIAFGCYLKSASCVEPDPIEDVHMYDKI